MKVNLPSMDGLYVKPQKKVCDNGPPHGPAEWVCFTSHDEGVNYLPGVVVAQTAYAARVQARLKWPQYSEEVDVQLFNSSFVVHRNAKRRGNRKKSR